MTQNPQSFDDYFAALERLKTGKALVVAKGTRITNDAVSLEAGRRKGSIKKSRGINAPLILAIEQSRAEQSNAQNEHKARLGKAREELEQARQGLDAALCREVSLLNELYETKKQLAQLTGVKVVPLRR